MSKKITIILGTAREGRQTEKVANAVHRILQKRNDIQTKFIDVKEYIHGRTIPPWEENEITNPWREVVENTDGFIIVAPEYNHGYPGELKMLLDQELEKYVGKPALVVSTSSGGFGGTRMVENLINVFRELGLIAMSYSIHVSKVKEFPEASKNTDEKFIERVNKGVDQMLDMI